MIAIKASGVSITVAVLVALLAAIQVVSGQGLKIEPEQLDPKEAGSDVTLECTCSECDGLQWHQNGFRLSERIGVVINTMDIDDTWTSMLSLEGVDETSAGQYRCTDPNNPFDQVTVSLIVEAVVAGVEIYEPTTAAMSVAVGKAFDLKCQGQEGVGLQWVHNGMVLQDHVDRVSMTAALDVKTGLQKSIMTRRSSVPTDGGLYVCRSADDNSNKAEVTVNIGQPSSKTQIIDSSGKSINSASVVPGRSFHLQCVADLNTDLAWFRENQELQNEQDGYLIQTAQDLSSGLVTSMLTKEEATTADSGQYYCQNTDSERDQAVVTVTVSEDGDPSAAGQGGAPTKDTTELIIRVGAGKLMLDCIVNGVDDLNVEWSKDGEVITDNEKYNIIIDSGSDAARLEISNQEREDAGFYECKFTAKDSDEGVAMLMSFNVITVKCPEVEAPVNGSFAQCPDGAVYGETCSFQCDSGLKLTYTKALVCELDDEDNAVWDKLPPQCKRTVPGDFHDAVPTSVSHVLLRVGGNQNLQCSESAFWNKGRSELMNDHKYVIRDNALIIRNTDKLDEGVYNCYVILRDQKGNVVDRGIKKFNVTTLPCPVLNKPAHGRIVDCSQRPVYGETCVFRCDRGYELSGSRSRTCELAHSHTQVYWTGDIPMCKSPGHTGWSPHSSSATAHQRHLATSLVSLFTASLWPLVTRYR